MFKKALFLAFVCHVLFLSSQANAQIEIGRHDEKTPQYGRIYFMIPEAYAMCMEETVFMTEVANLSYLDAYAYRRPPTEEQMEKLMRGEDFIIIPDMSKRGEKKQRTPEQMQEYLDRIKGVTRRPGRVAETVISKYNVRDFPSFIYLAPDLKVYKFDMPFCAGHDSYRDKFRALLGEFISGKRRSADRWNFGGTPKPNQ